VCAPEPEGWDPRRDPTLRRSEPGGERPLRPGEGPLSAEAKALYDQTTPWMFEERYDDIYQAMFALARREPNGAVLGRLVFACAGLASDPKGGIARVDALLADADAHPDDPLKQFAAGVAVHYRGHQRALTAADKVRDYHLAGRHLEPGRDVYAHVSRLWLYLGISYYRTGRQAEAEAAIARAAQVDEGGDADIYYSRAEILHQVDLDAALKDLTRYQALMKEQLARGAYSAPHKEGRVQGMLDHLRRAKRGEIPADASAWFDPVDPTHPGE